MGRPPKRARLWLDEGRVPPEWFVLDNVGGERIKQRTHCGAGEERRAEGRLAAYITERDAAAAAAEAAALGRRIAQGKRPPSEVSVAELMTWAIEEKGASMARPGEYASRWDLILDYAQEDRLDAIDNAWCRGFVAHAGSASYGRRCLEDLRAAGNALVADEKLTHMPRVQLPAKGEARPDYLTEEEVRALIATARWERDVQRKLHGRLDGERWHQNVVSSRYRWRHLVPYIVVSVLTCTRASRVYEASYTREPGRPWIDLRHRTYHRLAAGEIEQRNKRAPEVPLPDQLVRWLTWRTRPRTRRGVEIPGDQYLVQYAGRPVDCRKAFEACVEKARLRFPDLFLRTDGTPKEIVRHTLRHTGVTLLSQWGVPAGDICDYAGMSPEVYDRVYKHRDPDRMHRVMDAMGGRAKPNASKKQRNSKDQS